MCILALAWQAHPRWLMVAAGNRDELHARPAAPLARWSEPGHILAGRDLQSGGGWMGVSEEGRFAVVTNLRGYGGPDPDRLSRGALVTGLLSGVGEHADPARIDASAFNPFNLIAVDRRRAHFLSNRPEAVRTPLAHGIYGLSNGALDEPWPKTMHLKERLLDWLVTDAADPAALLDSLAIDRLPDFGLAPAQPSDAPLEPALSPIFIRNPVYGTRCGTVVAIDVGGNGVMIERRYSEGGEPVGDTRLSFRWPMA